MRHFWYMYTSLYWSSGTYSTHIKLLLVLKLIVRICQDSFLQFAISRSQSHDERRQRKVKCWRRRRAESKLVREREEGEGVKAVKPSKLFDFIFRQSIILPLRTFRSGPGEDLQQWQWTQVPTWRWHLKSSFALLLLETGGSGDPYVISCRSW